MKSDYEALKESITNSQFESEPLAACLLWYLEKEHPGIYSDVLSKFNAFMESSLKKKVIEVRDNDDACICD